MGSLQTDLRRHSPEVQQVGQWLVTNPKLPLHAQIVAGLCEKLAHDVLKEAGTRPDPELVAGLRKLVEAKDCFVRASLASPLGSP